MFFISKPVIYTGFFFSTKRKADNFIYILTSSCTSHLKNLYLLSYSLEEKEVLPLSNGQAPIKIHVTTNIYNGSSKDSIEWVGFGQYLEKDGSSYIKYEEEIEEGTIKTIVKVSGNEGLILRSGAVKMRLAFLLNKKRNGSYETPYGTFLMVTDTKRLGMEKEAHSPSGLIDILYDLNTNGNKNGTYHMTINFKEETVQA